MIGEGSYGRVYHVEDSQMQPFALKVSDCSHRAINECSLVHEAETLRELNEGDPLKEKAIIRLHGVYLKQDNRALLLDLEHCSLWDYQRRWHPFSIDRFALIVKDLAGALDYLKSKEIVHADIKPTNILITALGRVKLTDFGEAFKVGEERPLSYSTTSYIPPEGVVESGLHRYPSDVWSLGCSLIEMLKGRVLFPLVTQDDPLGNHLEYRGDLINLHENAIAQKYPPALLENALERGRVLYASQERPLVEGPRVWERFLLLFEKMLKLNPEERITATAMLQEPCLQDLRG
jgi:serine/threonine protein kinase